MVTVEKLTEGLNMGLDKYVSLIFMMDGVNLVRQNDAGIKLVDFQMTTCSDHQFITNFFM